MQAFRNTFCLRIQEASAHKLSDELLRTFANFEKTHLAVRERGEDDDNPHRHYFFYFQEGKKLPAFRQAITRAGFKGKTKRDNGYSLKAGIPDLCDDHLDYLCKGVTSKPEDEPDIIYRSPDITDAIVTQRHAIYHKINAYLPKKKRKREVNAAKVIGELEVTMRKQPKVPLGRVEMQKLAMRWYYENKTQLNIHNLRTVTNHISYGITQQEDLQLTPTALEHIEYVEKMEQQLFNNIE